MDREALGHSSGTMESDTASMQALKIISDDNATGLRITL